MTKRLLFWGTSFFGASIFKELLTQKEVQVVGVITQPDQPAGRHQALTPSLVKSIATASGIPVFAPEKLSDSAFINEISSLHPDVSVVVAYGRLIPNQLLDLPTQGALNIHPSLLPIYRGPSPIQAAILNGDSETGVSLMVLDNEMDHGPIIAQERVTLSGTERSPELSELLAEVGSRLLQAHLVPYLSGERTPQPQQHDLASVCRLITRDDGRIDWQLPAINIERQERAYDPWPGIWTQWTDGDEARRVKLFGGRVESNSLPSGVMQLVDDRLQIGTATTAISFGEMQADGKKRMSVTDTLRGWPTFLAGRLTVDKTPTDG